VFEVNTQNIYSKKVKLIFFRLTEDVRIEHYIKKYHDCTYAFQKKSYIPFQYKKLNLSFDPISKNLRMLTSAQAFNYSKGNYHVKLDNKPRRGEESFVLNNYGWESWKPWLYVKNIKPELNNIDAWAFYFENFNLNSRIPDHKTNIIDKNIYSYSDQLYLYFAIHIAVMKQIFVPSSLTKKFLSETNSFPYGADNIIGVHIRRGDTVSSDESFTRPNTESFSLELHALGVRSMSEKLQTNKVYISTDSLETIERFS